MPQSLSKLFSVFLFFFAVAEIQSQTRVFGYVLDELKQPIPFVNVYFENTTIGTTTDNNGWFELETNKKHDKLMVVLLGYENQTIVLTKQNNELKIFLKEGEQLEEVTVIKKPKKHLKKRENPAYKILKEVWKRKAQYGLNQFSSFEYENYKSLEVGLNNMDTLFLKKILNDDIDTVIQILRQNRKNKRFYIPLNLKEQHLKIYGDNKNKKYRSDLNAERITGIQPKGFFFKRIEKVFKEINVFKETVTIADKSFAGPLAKTGFVNYEYVLLDSIATKKGKEYTIHFFPRAEGDWAFEGNMTIETPGYGVKQIKLNINKKINLNFIRNLSVEYFFTKVRDSIYLPLKYHYETDFSLLSKSTKEKGLYLSGTELFSNYILEKPKEDTFYEHQLVYKKAKNLIQSNAYWSAIKASDLMDIKRNLLERLNDNHRVKSITENIEFLTNGYKTLTPWLQFGRWWDTFNYNDVEGFRMNFGFRSFKSLDDRFRTTGYVGYGFKSKNIKYGIDARYLLTYHPRITLGAVYSNDFEQVGSLFFATSPLLDLRSKVRRNLFSRGDNYYLTDEKNYGFTTDLEVVKNLHIGVNLEWKQVKSGAPDFFSIAMEQNGQILKAYNNTVFSSYLVYTPKRNTYGYGVDQRMGRGTFVTISLKYTKGIQGLFKGDFNYDQLQFSYNHPIQLGFIGQLQTNIELGKTFGVVPNSLLNAVPTNQGYSLEKNTFSLINYYDWITDTYCTGHFEHHFNGFILNKIPLIKHLKLRTLATFRVAYGTVSNENLMANRSNIIYNTPSEAAYYEYGLGIENIGVSNLRIFRLDFIWRSGLPNGFQTNSPRNRLPNFGIRIAAKPEL